MTPPVTVHELEQNQGGGGEKKTKKTESLVVSIPVKIAIEFGLVDVIAEEEGWDASWDGIVKVVVPLGAHDLKGGVGDGCVPDHRFCHLGHDGSREGGHLIATDRSIHAGQNDD